ncbi:MAG: SDR family NAD(P)-dependent oxidoreductase, partial [Acidimicrobiales bacterium]
MNDSLGAVQTVLVLGGTSEIGVAIAAELAKPRGAKVALAGRHPDTLAKAAEKVAAAGASQVPTLEFDALDTARHPAVMEESIRLLGDLDVVVVAFGLLGDPEGSGEDIEAAIEVARVNYVGSVSACLAAAAVLKRQGHGTLVVLSSVAGVRVRKANFVYGSSKAGQDGFALGLGDSLAGSGVRVMVVRPGYVKTKMTATMKAAPFSTTAEAVALATAAGLAKGKTIVWT